MCNDAWYLKWYTYYYYCSLSVNASRKTNDGLKLGVDMNIIGRVCVDRFFAICTRINVPDRIGSFTII